MSEWLGLGDPEPEPVCEPVFVRTNVRLAVPDAESDLEGRV